MAFGCNAEFTYAEGVGVQRQVKFILRNIRHSLGGIYGATLYNATPRPATINGKSTPIHRSTRSSVETPLTLIEPPGSTLGIPYPASIRPTTTKPIATILRAKKLTSFQ